jgi:hypothetical protein
MEYAPRVRCKTDFRLAGSPLPGRSRNLWTVTKGFRVIYITSPSDGLILTQAGLMDGASSTTSMWPTDQPSPARLSNGSENRTISNARH